MKNPHFTMEKKLKIKYIFFQFFLFFLINNHKIGEIGPKKKIFGTTFFNGLNHPNEQMK
jgi:hypothetical protein